MFTNKCIFYILAVKPEHTNCGDFDILNGLHKFSYEDGNFAGSSNSSRCHSSSNTMCSEPIASEIHDNSRVVSLKFGSCEEEGERQSECDQWKNRKYSESYCKDHLYIKTKCLYLPHLHRTWPLVPIGYAEVFCLV